jgi:Transposase DDE domain
MTMGTSEAQDDLFRSVRELCDGALGKRSIYRPSIPRPGHGHKTASRGFDGYKRHIAVDAESEIITATEVTAGNATAAAALVADLLTRADDAAPSGANHPSEKPAVYGDASYGTADFVEKLESAGIDPMVKVQPPSARAGMFSQDDFTIDTKSAEVSCSAGVRVSLRVLKDGSRVAEFGDHCADCPMRPKCTQSKTGRSIKLHRKHEKLDHHRKRQRDDAWKKDYRKVRPRVERKIGHMMRRKHGGRRARTRGRDRVRQDFALLAASINLARLAALGIRVAPRPETA